MKTMVERRFNPSKLEKLNNPKRLDDFPVDDIIQLMNIKNPEIIIDLGAGTAFFSIPFAKSFPQCKIFAYDVSDIMIEWMEKNIVPKFNNIFPLKMEENNVPNDDNAADVVFMVNVHHELETPEKTLNECYRLLKQGGIIAISDWRKEVSDLGPSFELRCEPDVVKSQLQKSKFQDIKYFVNFPNNFLFIARK
ncbi:MAG: class I SAM-dependent methyltransferase [Bacteroidales bacterium]|nr:class I SAM-dependent methyltransferase [Bacteroidales bacterium]